jgi:hypothetical protein
MEGTKMEEKMFKKEQAMNGLKFFSYILTSVKFVRKVYWLEEKWEKEQFVMDGQNEVGKGGSELSLLFAVADSFI